MGCNSLMQSRLFNIMHFKVWNLQADKIINKIKNSIYLGYKCFICDIKNCNYID